MADNYKFGPFPTGSVQIRKIAVNIKNISPMHDAILIRIEHYVNGAHIQLERIKRDAELMRESSLDDDGWDIGLWCQMLDAHFLAVSVNTAADLIYTLASDLESGNPNWRDIQSNYKIIDAEFLYPLRDALSHMNERLKGLERRKRATPKPAAFQLDIDEKDTVVFVWGDARHNLSKMVDDLTAIYEKTIFILEQKS